MATVMENRVIAINIFDEREILAIQEKLTVGSVSLEKTGTSTWLKIKI